MKRIAVRATAAIYGVPGMMQLLQGNDSAGLFGILLGVAFLIAGGEHNAD